MKQVKMIRVLEYIGPEDWIETSLAHSYVRKDGPMFSTEPQQQIRELLCIKEEVKK